MRGILLLLLVTTLLVLLVSGVVLNLGIVIIKLTGSIALTQEVVWLLYGAATLIVIGLLWLLVTLGGRK